MPTSTRRARRSLLALALALASARCGGPLPGDGGADARDGAQSDALAQDRAAPQDTLAPPEDASGPVEDGTAAMDVRAPEDASGAMDARVMDARVTDARADGASGADARADARVDSAADARADGGLALTGVPTCMSANVTATQLYNNVVSVSCAGARCHDPGASGGLAMGSAAQMRMNLLSPARTASIPRVTPRNLDASYVMYKLLNQHLRVPGGMGNRMPPTGPINNTQLCLFVNWIRGGAL